jgi:hypothetical protein
MNGFQAVAQEIIGGIIVGIIYAWGLDTIQEMPDLPSGSVVIYTLFGVAISIALTLATIEHLQVMGFTYLLGWIGGGLLLRDMFSTPFDWLIYIIVPVLLLGFKAWKMVTARAW